MTGWTSAGSRVTGTASRPRSREAPYTLSGRGISNGIRPATASGASFAQMGSFTWLRSEKYADWPPIALLDIYAEDVGTELRPIVAYIGDRLWPRGKPSPFPTAQPT